MRKHQRGIFFTNQKNHCTSMAHSSHQLSRTAFNKPPLSTDDLIALLQRRGLAINDVERAKRHLARVGYYRFMGYGKHFYDSRQECFKANTHYGDIWHVHNFDRKLRLLSLDAIERIEVAMRSTMSNELCVAHGAHWFYNDSLFSDIRKATIFRDSLTNEHNKQRHEITRHYKSRYSQPPLPPSWMIMECTPMGVWSKAFGILKRPQQDLIARAFGIQKQSFKSWAASLTWTRNVCAHHGVLWNRINKQPPKAAPQWMGYPDFKQNQGKYFATAVIAYGLLKKIVTKSTWSQRLESLFDEFPTVDKQCMGFNNDWNEHPFWDLNTTPTNPAP